MTDELRALIRTEIEAESPPPIGDLVEAAIREGRRQRLRRRLARAAAAAAAVGLALAFFAARGRRRTRR